MLDGILTSKDFYEQKKIEKKAGGKSPVKFSTKEIKVVHKYKFPPDKSKNSFAFIPFDGEVLKLELENGIFPVPDNWDRDKIIKFHKIIQIHGFVDVTTSERTVKKEKKIYRLYHPESNNDNPINTKVGVKLQGKEYKFDCVDGVVTTDNENVCKEFKKIGWNELITEEAKSDER